jgi:hypothetical protein
LLGCFVAFGLLRIECQPTAKLARISFQQSELGLSFGRRQGGIDLAKCLCELLDNEVRLRDPAAIIHDRRGPNLLNARFEIGPRFQKALSNSAFRRLMGRHRLDRLTKRIRCRHGRSKK